VIIYVAVLMCLFVPSVFSFGMPTSRLSMHSRLLQASLVSLRLTLQLVVGRGSAFAFLGAALPSLTPGRFMTRYGPDF
jgi:hypothetical protein